GSLTFVTIRPPPRPLVTCSGNDQSSDPSAPPGQRRSSIGGCARVSASGEMIMTIDTAIDIAGAVTRVLTDAATHLIRPTLIASAVMRAFLLAVIARRRRRRTQTSPA